MRRIVAKSGITLFAVLALMCIFGKWCALALLCLSLTGLVIVLPVRRFRKVKMLVVILAVTAFAGLLYGSYYCLDYEPAMEYCDKESVYSGTLVSLPEYSNDSVYYTVDVNSVDGEEVKGFKLRVMLGDKLRAEPGDTLTFYGTSYELGGSSTVSRLNYMSKRTYLGAYTSGDVEVTAGRKFSLRKYCLLGQEKLISSLRRVLGGDNAGIVIAILLGDRSYLSAEVSEGIDMAGVSHLLCVSGLHLSVWCLGLCKLLKKLRCKRIASYSLTIVSVVLFMFFTGFSTSVVRAGVMLIIFLLGEIFLKEQDSLTSLGAAAIVVLLNPFNAMSISFMLSFLSTLGIITIAVPLTKYLRPKIFNEKFDNRLSRRVIFYFVGIICTTFAATVVTLPATAVIFGRVVVISVLSNLLILPISSILMVSGLLTGIFGMFTFNGASVIFYPFTFAAKTLSSFVIYVTQGIANAGFGVISTKNVYILAWIFLFAAAVIIVWFILKKSVKLRAVTAAVLAVSFFAVSAFSSYTAHSKCHIRVLGVSSGYCVAVTYGGEAVLINCGGTYNTLSQIDDTFECMGVKSVNTVILTASSLKYTGCFNSVLHRYSVGRVVEPETMDSTAAVSEYGDTVVNNNGYYIDDLWDIGKVYYYAQEYGTVLLEVFGHKVLINLHDTDLSELPSEFSGADCTVVSKVNYSLFDKYLNGIIIADDSENGLKLKNCEFSGYRSGSAEFVIGKDCLQLRRVGQWEK